MFANTVLPYPDTCRLSPYLSRYRAKIDGWHIEATQDAKRVWRIGIAQTVSMARRLVDTPVSELGTLDSTHSGFVLSAMYRRHQDDPYVIRGEADVHWLNKSPKLVILLTSSVRPLEVIFGRGPGRKKGMDAETIREADYVLGNFISGCLGLRRPLRTTDRTVRGKGNKIVRTLPEEDFAALCASKQTMGGVDPKEALANMGAGR